MKYHRIDTNNNSGKRLINIINILYCVIISLIVLNCDINRDIYGKRASFQEENIFKYLKGHSGPVNVLKFGPDESILASGSGDNTIIIWDVMAGRGLRTLRGHSSKINCIDFNNNGRFMASGDDNGAIIIWDSNSGRNEVKIMAHIGAVADIAFNPRNPTFASCGIDNKIYLWNANSGKKIVSFADDEHNPTCIAFSSDGKILFSGGEDGMLAAWNSKTGKRIKKSKTMLNSIKAIALNPDKSIIIAMGGSNELDYLDANTFKNVRFVSSQFKDSTLSNDTFNSTIVENSKFNNLSISSYGGNYSSSNLKGEIKVWDIETFRLTTIIRDWQNTCLYSADFNLSGKLLAVGNDSGNVALYYTDNLPGKRMMAEDSITARKPSLPPNLKGSANIRDPNNNGLLDANETITIFFKLSNKGEGTAYNIYFTLEPEKNRRKAGEFQYIRNDLPVKIRMPDKIKMFPPKSDTTVIIQMTADSEVRPGEISYFLEARDANGFQIEPINVTLKTKTIETPVLKMVDYAVGDRNRNQRVDRKEIVDITARVQNIGKRTALAVKAVLEIPTDVFSTSNTRGQFELGDLDPGDFRDLEFSLFTNDIAQDMDFKIVISEYHNLYGITEEIRLPFNVIQKEKSELKLRPVNISPSRIDPVQGSLSEVDFNIPDGGKYEPNGIALLIGNYKYDNVDVPLVKYALNDIETMSKYIKKTFGFDDGNIIIKQNATKSEFEVMFGNDEDARGKLYKMTTPKKTRLIVYYTGHGAPDVATGNSYLLPSDFDPSEKQKTGYSLKTMLKNLAVIPTHETIVILDACFSGLYQDGTLIKNASPVYIEISDFNDLFQNGLLIASAKSNQIASWYPDKRHSMFTYLLLKGIGGLADSDNNKEITVCELEEYLCSTDKGVPYLAKKLWNREQTPVITSFNKEKVFVTLK